MILSMTGFSSKSISCEEFDIVIEMKSVNSKHLDLNLKLNNRYSYLEEDIRKEVKNSINRGKIELYIGIKNNIDDSVYVKLNKPLALSYIEAINELRDIVPSDELDISQFLSREDIFEKSIVKEENLVIKTEVLNLLRESISSFNNTRMLEGKELEIDLKSRIDSIEELVDDVYGYKDAVIESYKQKLESRIVQLADIEDFKERVAVEVAILAEKSDITEEIVRIKTHCKTFKKTLDSDDLSVGKKLDFIMQEINREINTIGSKSSSVDIANIVISVKSQIEKIREQVQNIQ